MRDVTGIPSPLRYPGGKGRLGPWLAWVLRVNGLEDSVFVEPYAGGAGASLYLLTNGYVSRVVINDSDPAITVFWQIALTETEEFIRRIRNAEISLEERQRQVEILRNPDSCSEMDLGWSAWYLNRVNFGGVIHGGPLSGENLNRPLDVRFNRTALIHRFQRLGEFRDRIRVHGMDALDFMDSVVPDLESPVLLIDPPYFRKSEWLYRDTFDDQDHRGLADCLRTVRSPWMLTYDACDEIRSLYEDLSSHPMPASRQIRSEFRSEEQTSDQEMLIYRGLSVPCAPLLRRSMAPCPAGFPSAWR